MSYLGRLIPNLFQSVTRFPITLWANNYHEIVSGSSRLVPGNSFTYTGRNKLRYHFPRPSERKRIKRHGWWHRMETPGGRRVLMRRILKGCHVLSH